jgi:hypothetical protein
MNEGMENLKEIQDLEEQVGEIAREEAANRPIAIIQRITQEE